MQACEAIFNNFYILLIWLWKAYQTGFMILSSVDIYLCNIDPITDIKVKSTC